MSYYSNVIPGVHNDCEPCPFCGNCLEFEVIFACEDEEWMAVQCHECQACGGWVYSKETEGEHEAINKAINEWNKRVIFQKLSKKLPTELIERLGSDAYKSTIQWYKQISLNNVLENREEFTKHFIMVMYRRFFDTVETAELARSF